VESVTTKRNERHGMSYTSLYSIWKSMRRRCNNRNHKHYALYGGRGISVCDSWNTSFTAFMNDVIATYVNGYEIDRINNDLGYFKENIRWVPHYVNMANRRSSGKYMTGASPGKNGKFASRIKVEKVYYTIGTFLTEKEAHEEFLKMHREWYGF
jgi:hypothetical protein